MGEIIDICNKLHEANARRIAVGVLDALGSRPRDRDLVEAIQYKVQALTNWFMVMFIIRRLFPAPSLAKVPNPAVIQNIVLVAIVQEGLRNYAAKVAASLRC